MWWCIWYCVSCCVLFMLWSEHSVALLRRVLACHLQHNSNLGVLGYLLFRTVRAHLPIFQLFVVCSFCCVLHPSARCTVTRCITETDYGAVYMLYRSGNNSNNAECRLCSSRSLYTKAHDLLAFFDCLKTETAV